MLSGDQGRRRVPFGFHRGQARARVLLRLEVLLGTADRSIRRIKIRRIGFRRARDSRGPDGLTRIAHFLDRGARAADEAGDTDKYRNEAQHKGNGH